MTANQINQLDFYQINQKVFQSSGMSFRITQRFNDKDTMPHIKKIYAEQGRIGHDGLDIVVFDDVRAVEGGEVIFADWDTKMTWATKGMYFGFGIMTIIWNKENNRLWVYAHLSQNLGLEVGQIVKKGHYIGQMGGSGRGNQNTWDVHLHIGLYEVDGNPTVLNRENGFWGGIDPLPYLIENKTENLPQSTEPKIPDRKFENVDYQNAWNNKDYIWFADSLTDRDGEVRRLKIEVEKLILENLDLKNQSKNENNQTVEKIVNQSQNVSQIQIMKEIDKEATFGFIKNHLPEITAGLGYLGYNATQDQILQSVSIALPFICLTASWFMEKLYKLNSKK